MPGNFEPSFMARRRPHQKTYSRVKRLRLSFPRNNVLADDKRIADLEAIANFVKSLDQRRWHIVEESSVQEETTEERPTDYIISTRLHKSEFEKIQSLDATVRLLRKSKSQPAWDVSLTLPREMLPLFKVAEFQSSMERRQTLRSWKTRS
jgi:hypothetical protein